MLGLALNKAAVWEIQEERGRGRGAYQQGGYYQVPVQPSQYLVPQPLYPQPQAQKWELRGGHQGQGGRRGRGKNTSHVSSHTNSSTVQEVPPVLSQGSSLSVHQPSVWTLCRTLCPNVETANMVEQTGVHHQGMPHPRLVKCDCAWAVSSNLQINHSTLGISTGGLVSDQTEQQASAIRLSHSGRAGLGSGCPQYFLKKSW